MTEPRKLHTDNYNLNYLLTLADDFYTSGKLAKFDEVMDLISRHFYPLSLWPQG